MCGIKNHMPAFKQVVRMISETTSPRTGSCMAGLFPAALYWRSPAHAAQVTPWLVARYSAGAVIPNTTFPAFRAGSVLSMRRW